MTTTPINLREWQVIAALEGRLGLIVTPLKVQPPFEGGIAGGVTSPSSVSIAIYPDYLGGPIGHYQKSPHYPGDLLWVRETWCDTEDHGLMYKANSGIEYSWRSPVTMPRRASRTTLRVESVTVKRVQEITEEEAMDMGISPMAVAPISPRDHFARKFCEAHGSDAWTANPWCAFAKVETINRNIGDVK